MTHVFIVNEQTFKVHLEYMFAGTGYGKNEPDFIECVKLSSTADNKEKTFASMIADISKVRIGDIVAFYVTGCKKFFGFFKVTSEPFYNPKSIDYLGEEENLNKYLPFRIRIEPYLVYSEGITEHLALDDIRTVEHPYEMCWSMIYRKLTGMRGCSFITDYEFSKMNMLISMQNKGKTICSSNYSYDKDTQRIIDIEEQHLYDEESNICLDIKERLLRVTNSHEVHLQAYILQNYDKNDLSSLLLPDSYRRIWIGNEVVCSVGEQRIDILLIAQTKDRYYIRIVELKDETPSKYIVEHQIKWYLNWVSQYINPLLTEEKEKVIIPTIIAKNFTRRTKKHAEFVDSCSKFPSKKISSILNATILPVEYIAYNKTDEDISFEKIF